MNQNDVEFLLSHYAQNKQRIKEIELVGSLVDKLSSDNSASDVLQSLSISSNGCKPNELEHVKASTMLVEKMIMSLSDKCRSVMEMLYIKGETYDRTSEILDISRSTVISRRKTAIKKMASMI